MSTMAASETHYAVEMDDGTHTDVLIDAQEDDWVMLRYEPTFDHRGDLIFSEFTAILAAKRAKVLPDWPFGRLLVVHR